MDDKLWDVISMVLDTNMVLTSNDLTKQLEVIHFKT